MEGWGLTSSSPSALLNPMSTCKNIVQRPTAMSARTGGDMKMASNLCGRDVVAGTSYCKRCTTNLDKNNRAAHFNHHSRLVKQGMNPTTDCSACQRGSKL